MIRKRRQFLASQLSVLGAHGSRTLTCNATCVCVAAKNVEMNYARIYVKFVPFPCTDNSNSETELEMLYNASKYKTPTSFRRPH